MSVELALHQSSPRESSATGEFGKNHLGDHTSALPTAYGFEEFWGYLYHLEALRTSSACSEYFHDTSARADDAPAGIAAGVSTFVEQASSVAVTCSLICSACA